MAAPGLTASENQQLQRLLAKAKTAAGPSGRGSLVPIYGSETGNMFDPTTGVSHNIWDDETESWDDTGAMFMGAMNDASKRREDARIQACEHGQWLACNTACLCQPSEHRGAFPHGACIGIHGWRFATLSNWSDRFGDVGPHHDLLRVVCQG